jgi:D-glycero-D-manno-heptose 1,7-bisphosphate phosphatase
MKAFCSSSLTHPPDEACEHDDEQQRDCRKLKPGMILCALKKFGVDETSSFMVGDHWHDKEADRRAGCRTVLIGDGYGEILPSAPTVTVASLSAAVSWNIQQSRIEQGSHENSQ